MKKLIFALVLMFLIFGIAHAASNVLSVDISKYDPYPAEPGSYIDVWINAQNMGTDSITDAQLKITPAYPFSLDPDQIATINIGTITAGQAVVSKVRIRVDQNAVQGDNLLDVQYKYGGFDWLTKRMDVYVQTHNSILAVQKISTEPSTIVPGKVSIVTFDVQNLADSFISDISIKLDLSNASLPFAPINSTTEQRIYSMDSKAIALVNFSIIASPDASAGVYKVPVIISYSDSTGKSYSRSDIISLIIGDQPKLHVYISDTTILAAGTSGTVKLIIVNNGLIDIKFLDLKLGDSSAFEKFGTDNVYIGSLDSDNTDTAGYTIYVKPTSSGSVSLPLTLQYMDKNNNVFTDSISIPLTLYSSSELSLFNAGQGPSYTWVFALVVIGIIGYFVYKRYFAKSK
jgi:hypothetical protein